MECGFIFPIHYKVLSLVSNNHNSNNSELTCEELDIELEVLLSKMTQVFKTELRSGYYYSNNNFSDKINLSSSSNADTTDQNIDVDENLIAVTW